MAPVPPLRETQQICASSFFAAHSDKCRLHVDADAAFDTTDHGNLACQFEKLFGEWTELHQSLPTRRQVAGNNTFSYSRLDRIHMNLPPQEVLDWQPYTVRRH